MQALEVPDTLPTNISLSYVKIQSVLSYLFLSKGDLN